MPILQRFLTQVGIAKETTWGTAVAPTTADQFIPVMNPKMSDEIEMIPQPDFRGLASKDFAVNQGFRLTKFSFEFQPQSQDIGNILMALLGGTDTVTGTNPYAHAIPQLNTGLPPSYTLTDYDATAATARQITGAYLESFNLTYAATGQLKAVVAFVGKYSGTVAKPTAVYDTVQPFMPWQNAATVNASTVVGARLVGLTADHKRPVEMVFGAAGTQDATAGNVGPIEAMGTATFYAIDSTEMNLYRNNTQGQLQFLFTASASQILNLNYNVVAFEKGTIVERTKEYVTVAAKYRAVYNSVDGGTLKATLTNTKAAAY